MTELKKLLERLEYECIQGNTDISISELVYDSRKAAKDDLLTLARLTLSLTAALDGTLSINNS